MGMDFSIIALIGLLMLIGIVKKNAIMMIDVAVELMREKAEPPATAIHEACVRRFRPIMMTTFAHCLALFPSRSARAPVQNCANRSASLWSVVSSSRNC